MKASLGASAVIAALGAAVVLWVAPTSGSSAPQTPAAPSYTPPRTPTGQPDLQGIWQVMNSAAWDLEDHTAQLGVPAGLGVVEGGPIPYLPAALLQKQQNYKNRATADPETKCYMPGVPRITYMPYPFEIHQFPRYVAILYEYIHVYRVIYTDGSTHPPGEGIEWWMGDSRGHWEGNTLVVDVIHFNDETWLDRAGNHHSKALHVVERYTRTGPDHMLYEATIEDPKVFSRPWKISMPIYRRQEKNLELLEYECYAYLDAELEKTEQPEAK